MKEVIEHITRALVDKPEEVRVEEELGQTSSILKVYVAKDDVGKVIGKKGANANAIRTLLSATSGKYRKKFVFEIVEYDENIQPPSGASEI